MPEVCRMNVRKKSSSIMYAAMLLTLGSIPTAPSLASDSVVIGRGISNEYYSEISCEPDELCMHSVYVIELDAKQTLAGPPVTGRVRALIVAHTEANAKYVKSIELFVLRPVENVEAGESKSPRYSLISLSTRHSGGKYCLDTDPNSLGLEVKVEQNEYGYFCFRRRDLLKAGRSMEPARER